MEARITCMYVIYTYIYICLYIYVCIRVYLCVGITYIHIMQKLDRICCWMYLTVFGGLLGKFGASRPQRTYTTVYE